MAEDAPTPDPSLERPQEDDDSKSSGSGDSKSDAPLWSRLSAHPLIVTVLGGVLVLLIGAYGFGIGRSPEGVDRTPDNAMEEVAARPFWTSPPRLYDDAEGQRYEEDNLYEGTVTGGDVVAVTPRELSERGSQYEGRSVYLVGKVTAQEDIDSNGLTTEYHLRGKDSGFDAYIAQDDRRVVRAPTGAVVYALGRIAAAGNTTDRGRTIKSVYFFCFQFCDFEIAAGLSPTTASPALRAAARGLGQSSSVSQMLRAP